MANLPRRKHLQKEVTSKAGTKSGKTSYQVRRPTQQDLEYKAILQLTLSGAQCLSGRILYVHSGSTAA